jgi:hypothetical protein
LSACLRHHEHTVSRPFDCRPSSRRHCAACRNEAGLILPVSPLPFALRANLPPLHAWEGRGLTNIQNPQRKKPPSTAMHSPVMQLAAADTEKRRQPRLLRLADPAHRRAQQHFVQVVGVGELAGALRVRMYQGAMLLPQTPSSAHSIAIRTTNSRGAGLVKHEVSALRGFATSETRQDGVFQTFLENPHAQKPLAPPSSAPHIHNARDFATVRGWKYGHHKNATLASRILLMMPCPQRLCSP